jgi:hypothetical protein
MAPPGRFIEIGKRDIDAFPFLPMAPFARNVTFASLGFRIIYQYNPEFSVQLIKEVQIMLDNEQLSPPQPVQHSKRSVFEEAFRFRQTGLHSGKAVAE